MTSTKPRKLTNHEKAVARIAQLITASKVLVAYNQRDHEETSVGPYTEAVDRGYRFACIGDKGRADGLLQRGNREHRSAESAAQVFIERVGSTRAMAAARAAAKRHGITLAV